mgnify:FL=1
MFLAVALLLASCGTDSRHFSIDGRLLNLNQGEFYVYSPDGAVPHGIDTIKVQAGRFTYNVECDRPMTLMIVFPNFTEQPVFAQPGKSVDIKGDASHLKEMTVKGTKANELMNNFREQILSASPNEMRKRAIQTAEDNPESPVATYLVRRYLIATDRPDYKTATRLLKTITQRQPDNQYAHRLLADCKDKKTLDTGSIIPSFATYDINGKTVSTATLSSKPTVVVFAWSSWNYSSTSMLRQLSRKARESNGNIAVVGICLNPDQRSCRNTLKLYEAQDVTTICDGKMVDGDVYNKLGMYNLPDNIVIKNGKIVARNLNTTQLMEKIK